ncbi:MAG TPA: DUF1194 domain-containing protein, partial [Geminicoccaceae bacterium]|nr:DUF1194 domain-containing protein [Geminicoccaceae bacterium]
MAGGASRGWGCRRRPRPGLSPGGRALAVAALWAVAGAAAPLRAQDVDLELVLAVDCSYSVSEDEFALQMGGLAAAFRDPEVLEAIAEATPRGLAVSLVQWSGRRQQLQVIPWTHVGDPADAKALADLIEGTPRAVPEGPTGIGEAI